MNFDYSKFSEVQKMLFKKYRSLLKVRGIHSAHSFFVNGVSQQKPDISITASDHDFLSLLKQNYLHFDRFLFRPDIWENLSTEDYDYSKLTFENILFKQNFDLIRKTSTSEYFLNPQSLMEISRKLPLTDFGADIFILWNFHPILDGMTLPQKELYYANYNFEDAEKDIVTNKFNEKWELALFNLFFQVTHEHLISDSFDNIRQKYNHLIQLISENSSNDSFDSSLANKILLVYPGKYINTENIHNTTVPQNTSRSHKPPSAKSLLIFILKNDLEFREKFQKSNVQKRISLTKAYTNGNTHYQPLHNYLHKDLTFDSFGRMFRRAIQEY